MFRNTALALVRRPVARNQARLFATTSLVQNKGPIEGAKDAVKSVDRAVSDTLVSGIEKGQQAKESAKETVGGKAKEVKEEAKEKKEEVKQEAKEKKEEAKSKI